MTEQPQNRTNVQDAEPVLSGSAADEETHDLVNTADGPISAEIEAKDGPPVVDATVGSNGAGLQAQDPAATDAPDASLTDQPKVSDDATLAAVDADSVTVEKASAQTTVEPEDTAEFQDLALITRFIIGLVLVGGDELLRRLQDYQADIEKFEELGVAETAPEDETQLLRIRYFVVGSVVRGQRRILRAAYRGLNSTGSLAGRVNRVTDNWLFQPIRRPVASVTERLVREVDLAIAEGRDEDRSGRFLARQTVLEFIDEFIDYISESPELADLVRDQIGEQSVGLAGTVVENTRQVSASADNALEGLVRKLFRLPQREELPPSPFVGEPNSLYSPNEGLAYEDKNESEGE